MMVTTGATFTVEAPCRADLAGGTLDIWPLGILHPGAVTVNAAIPVMVRLEVDLGAPPGEVWHRVDDGRWTKLGPAHGYEDLSAAVVFAFHPPGGVRVRVLSQASIGSGLGGSSAYGVALARGVLTATGAEMAVEKIAATVRDLEARVLGIPTGMQDHWPPMRGGVLAIHLEPGGERIERLDVDPAWVAEHLVVFDTGISHHSGMVNWQVIRRRLESDPETCAALEGISRAAVECRRCMVAGDAEGVGAAIAHEWEHRKRLAPEICPPELAAIEDAARAAGASAFKACGAGGGGSVLLWHGATGRSRLIGALAEAAPAGRVVATDVARSGCRVVASVSR